MLKKGEEVEGVTQEDALPALEQASEEIAGEISRSIEYYQSTGYMEEIHEVVLSGGGAMIPGFSDLLAQSVGLEVTHSDPFRNINIPSKFDVTYIEEMGPIATVAMGLAIRQLGDR
ncbi:hypothetical protein LCGC14_2318880 [marine sediment metagenome]|uniref:SHS2 domain-containing protein n=1 Tax=marine sediment metagenome TaxID=412755 RepID=A0A0F9CJ01_9ZZZZ